MGLLVFYLVCGFVMVTDPKNKEFINKLKEVKE